MPIHDLGYRTWQNKLVPEAWRFWVIGQTGMSLAWRSRILRRLMFMAWLPMLYLGGVLLVFEQALANPREIGMAVDFVSVFPDTDMLRNALMSGNTGAARHEAWAWLLLMFFRYPQGLLMALVVGLIAPPLVAKDVHSRAFLLYFSRPLTRLEYILGKLTVVCGYVLMITALPALALYLVGVLLSPPEMAVITSTWDIPLRIIAASLVLMIPTAALALAYSSLTTKSFYAGFAWFATWLLGIVAYTIIYATMSSAPTTSGQFSPHWALLSPYHMLGRVQTWIFGIEPDFSNVWSSVVLLAGIAVGALIVLFRRVSSPMRI